MRTKISQEIPFHESKERPWALTKEGPIHEVKKDHEGLESQKKKRKKKGIIIIKKKEEDLGQARGWNPVGPEDMQQEEGSQLDQKICSKMYVHISNKSH